MDSLTEREISHIARLQREAGLQRLSCHFSWPDFCDERQRFHQEFVYDTAMFAASRGFSWSNVIRAAVIVKDIFPQLDGHDLPKLSSLLMDTLSECLPNLTPVHRHEFTRYLTDTCVTRRRLFQAVVGGAANMSIAQVHSEVQLPPTPCPLAQGMELHEWEHQQQQAQLIASLQQKEEQLKSLREGLRVTLEEVDVPEEEQLDKEGALELVRAAVKATEGQMLASLHQEASLLGDILQLKLQCAALATGRLHNPAPAHISPHPDTSAKAKLSTGKSKAGHKV
ncbi:uncharacterized protein C8orf74 homolog [Scomber scombrus]|uniref:uncharacterized protein C8orf74 homolog n=1 Tax=Scomber scombrus TaxID=13677 RepID=UPI002DDB9650|nr:uncharacterized protein C8orf74 homolog [Scomber scombrus]